LSRLLNKFALSNKTLLHLALIVLLGLLAYSNTFDIPFVFDDEPNIRDNPLIKDFIYFKEPVKAEEVPMDYDIWFTNRIVGYLTFALNHAFHGLDVRGYHAVNLANHIANALLIYWLVLLTFMTPFGQESSIRDHAKIIALFSGVLFVSHPIHTQAVTYIVQRFASLATFFYLLSLALYIRCRLSGTLNFKSITLYVLFLFSAVLAMKTKEIAFTLPLVIALYEFMFFRGLLRKRLPYLVPILLTMLIIPMSLLGADKPIGNVIGEFQEATRLVTEMPRSDYLFTQFHVISTYIRLLFLPVNQNLDYDYPVFHSLFDLPVFFSFLFLASIFGIGIILLHKSRTAEPAMRLASFGILWFFITLSVESSVIPIVDVIFEHRVYLPNAGIIVATVTAGALLVEKINGRKMMMAAIVCGVILTAVLGSATYARNSTWKNNTSIWEDVVSKSPEKWRGHHNLGNEYQEAGLQEKAIQQYKEAIRLNPDDARSYNDLGISYKMLGLYDKALEHYLSALRRDPNQVKAYNNIGNIYIIKELYDEGIDYFKIALTLKPDSAETHYNMGNALYYRGQYEKAIEHYRASLDINPNEAKAYNNLGVAYLKLGHKELALKEVETALRLDPRLKEARESLEEILEAYETVPGEAR
jgi:tetratricopeptide (TPR) repeat protein